MAAGPFLGRRHPVGDPPRVGAGGAGLAGARWRPCSRRPGAGSSTSTSRSRSVALVLAWAAAPGLGHAAAAGPGRPPRCGRCSASPSRPVSWRSRSWGDDDRGHEASIPTTADRSPWRVVAVVATVRRDHPSPAGRRTRSSTSALFRRVPVQRGGARLAAHRLCVRDRDHRRRRLRRPRPLRRTRRAAPGPRGAGRRDRGRRPRVRLRWSAVASYRLVTLVGLARRSSRPVRDVALDRRRRRSARSAAALGLFGLGFGLSVTPRSTAAVEAAGPGGLRGGLVGRDRRPDARHGGRAGRPDRIRLDHDRPAVRAGLRDARRLPGSTSPRTCATGRSRTPSSSRPSSRGHRARPRRSWSACSSWRRS